MDNPSSTHLIVESLTRAIVEHRLLPGTQRNTQQTLPLSKCCLQPPINDGGLPALQHPTLQHQLGTLVCILHMLPPSPHSQGHQPMVALLHTGMDRSVAGSSGMGGACYKGGPAPS